MGIEVATVVALRAGRALLVEEGALYPALFRLVRQGLLEATWGTSQNNRRAKFYELTSAGRERLGEEADGWNRLAAAVASEVSGEVGRSVHDKA